MILITFALPQEGAVLAKRIKSRQIRSGVVTGLIDGQLVGIYYLGLGFKDAERFRGVIEELKPELIINSGFAGALSPELQAGDFILASNATSSAFLDQFRETGMFDQVGYLQEVNEVMDPTGKERIWQEGNAIAIDMESDRLAAICRNGPFPHLTARMVSDCANESIPSLFVGRGVRAWSDISDAVRFIVRMLKLRKRLAERLRQLVRQICSEG